MHRNNFLPHVALALVLILVAAFAGQLRRWQKQWKQQVRIMPAAEKPREAINNVDSSVYEPRTGSSPEIMVRFKPGVSAERVAEITSGMNDVVEDQIEAVPGLDAIDDLDDADAEEVATQYRKLPEVEYAEAVFDIEADDFAVSPVT